MKFFAIAALLLASSSAFAGIITHEAEFGTQGSSTDVDISGLNETLSFSSFDTALGRLTGVSINVFGQIDSAGSVQNLEDNLSRAAIDIRLDQDWLVSTSFNSDYVLGSEFNTLWSGESSPINTYTLGQNDIFDYDASTGLKEAGSTFTGAALAAFTNGDAIDFTFTAGVINVFRNQSDNGINDYRNRNSTASWGKVTIEYTYTTDVSEPGTLAIFGLGLVGFAASCKKKSA